MVLIGFFLSIISGLILSIDFFLLGEIMDIFVYHSNAISEVDNTSISSLAQSLALSYNVSCDTLLQQDYLLVQNITNTSSCLSQNPKFLDSVLNMACEPRSRLQSEIQHIAYFYIVIAFVDVLATFIGMMFFNISAYRQTRTIRQAFYRSILYQEIGWFDVTDPKELNSRLIE